jgi:hypothetical protein
MCRFSQAEHSTGGRWTGKVPVLQLINCLIEDDTIKSAFVRHHNSKDRIQLDNQTSMAKRDPTMFDNDIHGRFTQVDDEQSFM